MVPIKSKNHLYFLLGTNKAELKEILENLTEFYTPYTKTKRNKDGSIKFRNGKMEIREFCPSIGRLKELQQKIKIKILKNFDFPEHIQGGIKGRSNISNAFTHKGKKYFFSTDIRNFFPSIKYKAVYNMYISFGFSADVSSLLTKLTTYKYKVPQGIPTSTYITNLVSVPIDKKLLELCNKNEINYTRYIDDLSFSSKRDFLSLVSQIIDIIQKYKLRINQRKTFYKIGPTIITGVLVKNNILKASKEIFVKLDGSEGAKKRSLENYIERIHKATKTS